MGQLGDAAKFIENTLANFVPLLLDFLARLLRLGNVSEKIKKILMRVRKPIDDLLVKIMTFIKNKIKGFGKKGKKKKETKDQTKRDMKKDKGKDGVTDVDRKKHREIGEEIERELKKPIKKAKNFEEFYQKKTTLARKLEKRYQRRLKKGIKVKISFGNLAKEKKDNDIDFRVRIAPNTFDKSFASDFDGNTQLGNIITIEHFSLNKEAHTLKIENKKGIVSFLMASDQFTEVTDKIDAFLSEIPQLIAADKKELYQKAGIKINVKKLKKTASKAVSLRKGIEVLKKQFTQEQKNIKADLQSKGQGSQIPVKIKELQQKYTVKITKKISAFFKTGNIHMKDFAFHYLEFQAELDTIAAQIISQIEKHLDNPDSTGDRNAISAAAAERKKKWYAKASKKVELKTMSILEALTSSEMLSSEAVSEANTIFNTDRGNLAPKPFQVAKEKDYKAALKILTSDMIAINKANKKKVSEGNMSKEEYKAFSKQMRENMSLLETEYETFVEKEKFEYSSI